MEANKSKSPNGTISWVLVGVLVLCSEARFANELQYRWHSYFMSSAYHQRQLVFFIFTMILIPVPWIAAVLESRIIEKSSRSMGADEKSIAAARKSTIDILAISYFVLMMSIGSMADLLPLQ